MVIDQPTATEVHESTEALIMDFSKPRESKAPANTESKPITVTSVIPLKPSADDFVEEESETIETEVTEEKVTVKQKKNTATVVSDESDFSSDVYIGVFDTAQTGLFTWQMKRRLKKKLETSIEQAKVLCKKIDKGIVKESDLNETQLKDLIIFQSFLADSEEIPLDDKEYKKLHKLLARVIEENGGKLPAGLGIALAGISIISKRISLLAD